MGEKEKGECRKVRGVVVVGLRSSGRNSKREGWQWWQHGREKEREKKKKKKKKKKEK